MKEIVPSVFHGGNLESAAEQYGFAPTEMIDFSANISWLGTPPKMEEAVERGLALIQHFREHHSGTL